MKYDIIAKEIASGTWRGEIVVSHYKCEFIEIDLEIKEVLGLEV